MTDADDELNRMAEEIKAAREKAGREIAASQAAANEELQQFDRAAKEVIKPALQSVIATMRGAMELNYQEDTARTQRDRIEKLGLGLGRTANPQGRIIFFEKSPSGTVRCTAEGVDPDAGPIDNLTGDDVKRLCAKAFRVRSNF